MNKNIKNKYFIKAIVLENCPYSINAEKLLNEYKIKHDIIRVTHITKNQYKNATINTFPQIYLKKLNYPDNLLIGGYSNLKSLIDTFRSNKYDDTTINDCVQKLNLSKKILLKIINLIN
jgi:glutaredoxin